MERINLIIFSKDRAAQLHLLLQSLVQQGYDEIFNIVVLWKTSNWEFNKGYIQCSNHFLTVDFFEQEGTFWKETDSLINEQYRLTAFSTDDMVFYRTPENGLLEKLTADSFHESCVFSFRLGYNTIEQDIHVGTRQSFLNLHVVHETLLKWNPSYYHPHSNYGYPLAIDTHVFHTSKLVKWIGRAKFRNTNDLETLLQQYRHEVTELWSFPHSVAVNVPANTISGVTQAGQINPLELKEANELYLSGKSLSLKNIQQTNVVGCHQEIKHKWE